MQPTRRNRPSIAASKAQQGSLNRTQASQMIDLNQIDLGQVDLGQIDLKMVEALARIERVRSKALAALGTMISAG